MVGRIAMLVVAACCAAAVSTTTVNSAAAEQSATEAEYLASIAHLREQSIKEGKIYGDTLLRFDKLDESIKAYGSAENATSAYNSMNRLLLHDNPTEINKGTAKILNMVVFSGGTLFDKLEHVAALVIGEQKAEGTYDTPPAELMREYHQYLLDTYDVRPGTASAELDSMMVDLRPLAPEVLRIFELPVSKGRDAFKWATPPEQQGDDSDWEDTRCASSGVDVPADTQYTRIEWSGYVGTYNCNNVSAWCDYYDADGGLASGYKYVDTGPPTEDRHIYGTRIIANFSAEVVETSIPDDYIPHTSASCVWHHPQCLDNSISDSTVEDGTKPAETKTHEAINKNPHSPCVYDGAYLAGYGLVLQTFPVSIHHPVSVTLTTATISWDAHDDVTSEGYDTVLLWDSTTIHDSTTTATSETITSLTADTQYTAKVSVKGVDNTEGTKGFSTMWPVRNFYVKNITSSSATVLWDQHPWHENGYKVELWQAGTRCDTYDQDENSIGLTGLTANTEYTIKVSIQDEDGTEGQKNFATLPDGESPGTGPCPGPGPVPPGDVQPIGGLMASVIWKSVTASWNESPDVANPTYRVEVWDGDTKKESADTTGTTKTFTLPSHDYEIRVCLKDYPNTWSNFVAVSVPADVQGVTVGDREATSADVSWNAYDFGGSGETATYKIEWREEGKQVIRSDTTDSTSKTLTGLSPSTGYEVRVSLAGEAGSASGWVGFVTERKVDPVTGVGVSATHNSATISWNAHEDVTSRGYIVDLRRGDERAVYIATSTSKTITGLPSDTSYMVRVGLNANYVDEDTFSAWKNFRTDKEPACSSSTGLSEGDLREYQSMSLDNHDSMMRDLFVAQSEFEADTNANVHAVSALVVAKAKLDGMYDPATDAERRYSEWVVDTHDTPDNAADIDATLNLIGKPKQIDSIHDTNVQAANAGHVPFDLEFSDPLYWMDITLQSRCKLVGDTCGMTAYARDTQGQGEPEPDLIRLDAPVKLVLKVKADNTSPRTYMDSDVGSVSLSGEDHNAQCRGGYTATATNEAEDWYLVYRTWASGEMTNPDGCSKLVFGSKIVTISCSKAGSGTIRAEATGGAAIYDN